VAVSTSANNGTYELLVPAGSYRIVFEDRIGVYASVYYLGAESFDTSTTIEIAAGGSIVDVDAALQRGGRIAGNVRDADSGAPLGSIVVAAYNASGTVRTFTTTDANGAYTLVVPPGSYKVGAYDANIVYAPRFHSGQPAFAYGTTTTVASGATVAPIDFLLRRGGHLSGRVTDRATGAPIAGITVAAYDLSGTRITSVRTAAGGTYRLVLAAGVYRLVAFDEGLHYANGYLDDSANLDASRTVTVAGEAEVTALDFSMSAGAKVSGNVVDLTHGGPVAGVMVTAYDLAATAIASVTTDPSGNFAFVVPSGTYRFVAADPLHRFETSFFQNASGFDDARQVTLIAGSTEPAILFRLIAAPPPARRRAVRH
jgi:5-hydroxyisourate hydrolase-like protein (transthyretin family)